MKELDDTVKTKTREFGKQAQLAFTKTHTVQQTTEEAKDHAGSISSKFNNIEKKKYEAKLSKFGMAIDS